MTALTRLIDAYNAHLKAGLESQDAICSAQVDCHVAGDNFLNIAAGCFPKEA